MRHRLFVVRPVGGQLVAYLVKRLAEARYSWDDIARRLEEIYERVTGTEAEARAA